MAQTVAQWVYFIKQQNIKIYLNVLQQELEDNVDKLTLEQLTNFVFQQECFPSHSIVTVNMF